MKYNLNSVGKKKKKVDTKEVCEKGCGEPRRGGQERGKTD